MITKKQLLILGNIGRFPFKNYTFNDIKKFANEHSNSVIQRAIAVFKEEELILEEKRGKTYFYILNIENTKTLEYLSIFFNEMIENKAIEKDISRIKREISRKNPFICAVIFGSFADGKNKADSDLDIAFFVDEEKRDAKIIVSSIIKKCIEEIHAEVFTKKEFIEMLSADYENVGKEIARKNIPFYNVPIFYNLLKEGIEHGFKG